MTKGLDLKDPGVLLATWFGAGLLPRAPGTWGSLAALPCAWVIQGAFGWQGLALAAAATFLAGIWAANRFMARAGGSDPAPVVIDEVAGQFLTLLAVEPDLVLYGAGFVLFRAADIFKPWPASWADSHVKGGLGVMLDDVIAGAYAALALYGVGMVI